MNAVKPKSVLVHGRAVNCVEAGSGPVLLLIHGMAGNIGNWQEVIGLLARHYTVIAPDLPGHGASAPGAGDYSLGALAAGLRDLLVVLGHERATLVGHSLGGGIAMQFAYQFPEITERLVLVSSGGLGPEVSPVLRAAALPGADLFIAATAAAGRSAGAALARGLAAAGLRPAADIAEVARGYASLADPGRRAAFLATLRSVIGVGGQRVYAGDRSLPRARQRSTRRSHPAGGATAEAGAIRTSGATAGPASATPAATAAAAPGAAAMATAHTTTGAPGTAAGTPAATAVAPAGTRTRARAHTAAGAAPGAASGSATADVPAHCLTSRHQLAIRAYPRRPG